MPRIVGVEIPPQKRIDIALTYIYGVGPFSAKGVLKKANIDPSTRAKDMTGDEIARITVVLQKEYKIEGDLRREVSQNIKRLADIGSFRGIRHRRGLPVRGQRTHTNARTRKGPRRLISRVAAAPKSSPTGGKG
jgi:small subunit ribosomal protein S13